MPGLALRELRGELAFFYNRNFTGFIYRALWKCPYTIQLLDFVFFGRIFIIFALPRAETEIPHGGAHVLASLCAILSRAHVE